MAGKHKPRRGDVAKRNHEHSASQRTFCEKCGKVGYYTKQSAKIGRRVNHASDHRVSIYKCPFSNTWHLGHMPQEIVNRGFVDRRTLAERAAAERAWRQG